MVASCFDIGIKKIVLFEFLTLCFFFTGSCPLMDSSFCSIGPFCNVNNVSVSHNSAWVSLNDSGWQNVGPISRVVLFC